MGTKAPTTCNIQNKLRRANLYLEYQPEGLRPGPVWTGGTGLVLTRAALPQLALEQRCRELRARGRRLEETLPRRIGSEEQREVLSLLCRVHELEVENTEMQSHALLRDSALRHRREAVRRLEQHRSLCDEIIQGQRQIIDGRAQPHGPGTLSLGLRAQAKFSSPLSPDRLQSGGSPAPGGTLRSLPSGTGRGQPGAGHHHGPSGLQSPAGGRVSRPKFADLGNPTSSAKFQEELVFLLPLPPSFSFPSPSLLLSHLPKPR